jgi:N-acetyl-anhydromuramyl-L-alanine amidase AmpD
MKKLTLAASAFLVSAVSFAATPDLPSCDVWVQACHWTNSSREASYDINRVVIHKTQGGTASGAASWFANCSSGGSAHFTFDKSNGYCYQSVYEADIAWHAGYGSTNNNSVGIEHSGWVNNNDTSTACYNESAVETKSCVTYYGVPANRSYVIGHSEVPGCSFAAGGGTSCHTDPGPNWNWSYYMGQVGGSTPPPTLPTYTIDNSSAGFSVVGTWATGSSAADKYGADYRYKSTNASSEPASWAAGVTGGTYRVQAWWAAGTNRSATAPYILPNGTTVAKNQQTAGGTWNTLGTIGLSGTATTKLSIWTTAGYIVVADAVRYTP